MMTMPMPPPMSWRIRKAVEVPGFLKAEAE